MMVRSTALALVALVASTSAFLAPTTTSSGLVHTTSPANSRASTALSMGVVRAPPAGSPAAHAAMKSLAERRLAAEGGPSKEELAAAPVLQISSTSQYQQLLSENPDKLVVFKWFAPWCRSCKGMDSKWRALALAHKDSVLFAEVNIDDAKELQRAHGITAIPAVQLHAGEFGLVDQFTCGMSKVPKLAKRIALYADVDAYARRANGGIMEKLATYSAGPSGRVPVAAAAAAARERRDAAYAAAEAAMAVPSGAARGLMERMERLAAQTAAGSSQQFAV